MNNSTLQEKKFSAALLRAIDRIAYQQRKTREVVREQLSHSIGRNATSLDHWLYRRRLPKRIEDLENLARQIATLGGWQDAGECLQFLLNADHPAPNILIQQIFPDSISRAAAHSEDTSPLPKSLEPFVVGTPIQFPSQFFGRERELRRIFKALQGHLMQNIAITGAQRSGKTSLLHYIRKITRANFNHLRPSQFSGWLAHPTAYHWVYVDFQDARTHTQEGFFRYVLNRLALPAATATFSLANFIEIISENTFDPTVILFDEIQVALEIEELNQEFWWGLRSLASNQTEGKLCYIISSQKEPEHLFYQSERPSPFFNIFGQHIALGPLTGEEARQLIQSSPLPFEESDQEWIVQNSHNWPALLQILCQARLMALEEDVPQDQSWKTEGLKRISPFQHLLKIA